MLHTGELPVDKRTHTVAANREGERPARDVARADWESRVPQMHGGGAQLRFFVSFGVFQFRQNLKGVCVFFL